MKRNFLLQFYRVLLFRFNLNDDKASDEEIISGIRKGIEFKGTNLWTLIFAIFIASIGLDVNSTAVIIGAMLISPLMGPITGVGLGAGIYDFDLIKKAGKNLLIATLIALFTSTLYFFVSPLHQAQSELLARTSPTIWDVLIAFVGGTAGIVASTRKQFNNIIPGVAIATALMPPLCTAGFGLANLEWGYFFGALYLYLINSVFISIATFLMVRFLGIAPSETVDSNLTLKVKRWVAVIALCTIVPSVYLAYKFVSNEVFNQKSILFIKDEIQKKGLVLLNQKINANKKLIALTILTDLPLDSLNKSLKIKLSPYGLGDANLEIRKNQISGDRLSAAEQMQKNLIENLFKTQEVQIERMKDELMNLQNPYKNNKLSNENKLEIAKEYKVIFGEVKELRITESTFNAANASADTLVLVYVHDQASHTQKSQEKMSQWLKVKLAPYPVKLVLYK